MLDFEVGEIPSDNIGVVIRDERDNAINLIGYPLIEVEILGTDDEKVDLTGVTLTTLTNAVGAVAIGLPKNRSLFTKKGEYKLRVVLRKADGSKDITRSAQINVREFGRIK